MAGLLPGASIKVISVLWVFYWGLLLERSQYGESYTGGFY